MPRATAVRNARRLSRIRTADPLSNSTPAATNASDQANTSGSTSVCIPAQISAEKSDRTRRSTVTIMKTTSRSVKPAP